jgi:hypothetical protein
MKRGLLPLLLVACVLALAAGLRAQPVCSNRTLLGVYMVSCKGFQDISATNPTLPKPTFVPYACEGRVVFDGRGNGSMVINHNIGGVNITTRSVVTLRINEDCTAETEYESFLVPSGAPLGKTLHKGIGMVDGSEFVSINAQADPIVCQAKRIGPPSMAQ